MEDQKFRWTVARESIYAATYAARRGGRTMETTKLLLTVSEAASLLSLGRSKTYELVRAGVIPSVRITGSRRIKASDLLIYVAGLGEAA
jgi:excisionase family DNA binding protein